MVAEEGRAAREARHLPHLPSPQPQPGNHNQKEPGGWARARERRELRVSVVSGDLWQARRLAGSPGRSQQRVASVRSSEGALTGSGVDKAGIGCFQARAALLPRHIHTKQDLNRLDNTPHQSHHFLACTPSRRLTSAPQPSHTFSQHSTDRATHPASFYQPSPHSQPHPTPLFPS